MHRLMKTACKTAVGLLLALAGLGVLAQPVAAQEITLSPSSADFGNAAVRVQEVSRLIEVTNTGNADLEVTDLKMVGANVEEFWFSVQWPFTLAPGEDRRIVVSFGPASEGPKGATLQIFSNAMNEPRADVTLTGRAVGLSALGRVSASASPSNAAPQPGDLITVEVRVNMSGANPPAHLLQNYQASLSWDPAVLSYQGAGGGDAPWGSPASIGQSGGALDWFDVAFSGGGGGFAILRPRFRVVGTGGASTDLTLRFSRLEGKDVENLLPILSASGGRVEVADAMTPPDIDVTPSVHAYGAVAIGSRVSQTFVIRNTGRQNLVVGGVSLAGPQANQFSIGGGGGSFTLAEGQRREVVVSYAPTSAGLKAAALLIRSNDPDESVAQIILGGSVPMPNIEVRPGSLNFGTATVGSSVSRTLVVRNTGTGILRLTLFGLDGHQNQFAYNTGFLPFLMPGRSANIVVYFRPTSTGARKAAFVIHSNDPDDVSVSIPLAGTGIRRP
jgi:Abnormal spindle-like microcephaly-assoc'd, ASPM-SPD-2-Hydin